MTFERGRPERERGFAGIEPLSPLRTPDASLWMDEDPKDARTTYYQRGGKRIFDVGFVLFCAPVWIPLILVLACLVMFDGANPFYSQQRVGRGGKLFRMWKIRSMVKGADALLEQHLSRSPAIRAEWDENQKLTNDPRVTRFGRFLRMTSLDELPQLWNVLTGDMSLVGPRPMMDEQRPLYPGQAYYAMRPGVTGPWQVYARSRSSFVDRVAFDERYYRDSTFALDIKLICKTTEVVLSARGM